MLQCKECELCFPDKLEKCPRCGSAALLYHRQVNAIPSIQIGKDGTITGWCPLVKLFTGKRPPYCMHPDDDTCNNCFCG